MYRLIMPEEHRAEGPCSTVALCGDGHRGYWLWCDAIPGEKHAKQIKLYMTIFTVQVNGGSAIDIKT